VSSTLVALLVAASLMGGALLGLALQSVLPEHHLGADSKEVVRLAGGITATVSALVLSLLIASANSSFNTQRQEIQTIAARIIGLDDTLAVYGPGAGRARGLLRRTVDAAVARIWHEDGLPAGPRHTFRASGAGDDLHVAIEELSAGGEVQAAVRAQALAAMSELMQTRLLLFEQADNTVPAPLLAILVAWLTAIFASFGLFAPRNPTVIAALLLSVLSVAAAVFLMYELDGPFTGLMKLSSAPLRDALPPLGQ
jgi:hypothetical protein